MLVFQFAASPFSRMLPSAVRLTDVEHDRGGMRLRPAGAGDRDGEALLRRGDEAAAAAGDAAMHDAQQRSSRQNRDLARREAQRCPITPAQSEQQR